MFGLREFSVSEVRLPRVMVEEVESYPLGDGQALVHSKYQGKTVAVSKVVADLAMTCRHLDTVAGHLKRYFDKLQVSRELEMQLSAELTKLIDDGFFLREERVLNDLTTHSADKREQSIGSLCFPTCNRVQSLHSAVTSYLDNARQYGRNISIVIADDSQSPSVNNEYQTMLCEIKREFNLPIFYAGSKDKYRFAAQVAKYGGLPEEIVKFALLGDGRFGTTTVGGNRNTLLLQTLGQLIVQVDDDTRCVQSIAPHATEEIRLTWQANPMEATFFDSRKDALSSVAPVEQDLLGLHENWLGKFSSGAIFGKDAPLIDTLDVGMLRRMIYTPSRICVSVSGSLGDCSWDDPDTLLFQPASVLTRIADTEDAYLEARSRREVAQAAGQVTIAASADPLFSMCVGIDNKELLPPFTPVGRAEEIAFAMLLHKCFDNSLAVFLPWTIQHVPSGKRTFREPQNKIGLETCVTFLLETIDIGFASTPAKCFQTVGKFFSEMGRMSEKSLESYLQTMMWQNTSQVIQFLEQRISDRSNFKRFQIEDMAARVELMRQEAFIPMHQRYALEGGYETLRALLRAYGQMLEIWPDLVAVSCDLQQRGIGIARQL